MNIRKIYLPHSLAKLNLFTEAQSALGLKQAQRILKNKGFYQGDEDGIHDDKLSEAILQFQKVEGLLPTGKLDPATYCHLHDADIAEVSFLANDTRANLTLPNTRILITKDQRQLTLFNGNTPLRNYPVGIGKPATPTPEGNFSIATKIMNPGGVLGSRWMGLNFDPNYGIHGNNAPWSIGHLVSKGCIRMHNSHVEEVFALVRKGTPVFIRNSQ